ncbi:MAG: O-antigen ligase family protein [Cyanobacteria bacterium J06632_19]
MFQKTDISSTESTKNVAVADKFLHWHSWVLLGYGIFGRGFAYFGVSPLFIGEITLAFGLITLTLNKSFPKLLKLPQTWFLIVFMMWCCINTIPYYPRYGLFAIRDAALWYYCFFALIIGTLLVSKPRRFLFMVEQYKRFTKIFLILMPLLRPIPKSLIPRLPGSGVPFIFLKGADVMNHLGGVSAFLLGTNFIQTKVTFFFLMLLINLGVVAPNTNRSGMLAFLNSFTFLSFVKSKNSRILRVLAVILFVILLFLIIKPDIFDRLFTRLASIFVEGDQRNQGTKEYRLEWWTHLINTTIFGDYFWTGRGFGFNLGAGTGFDPTGDGSARSPHNGHITVLARTGVPGALMWLLVQLSWAGTILVKYFRSRAKGETKWAGIFLTLLCYWITVMTTTSFEVIIEGPSGAVWFWTMYGVGLAAIYIYKRYPEIFDEISSEDSDEDSDKSTSTLPH